MSKLVNLRKRELKGDILFDENTHKYYLDGKELISTTRLLSKIGVAPDYSNVDAELLKKSAAKGNLVHQEIEEWIKFGKEGFTGELQDFIKWLEENDYTVIDSEYLVYNDVVGGKVDLLLENNKTHELVIADIKTTSQIHYDSVAWQLSIYALLGGEPIDRAFVFHFDKEKGLVVAPISFKKVKDIENLFNAVREGKEYELPTIALEGGEIEVIHNALVGLAEIEKKKKEYEEVISSFKEKLINAMEEQCVKSMENDYFKITYVAPVEKVTIDSTRLKKEKPEIAKEYSKSSTTKASVRITLKEGEEDE